MVRDLVLDDLDAERVGLPYQLAQCRQVAETIFNGVIIDRVIAVIVRVRTPRLSAPIETVPVVVPGRQSESGDAEILEIWELIDDAAQIAAMKRARVVSIVCFGR